MKMLNNQVKKIRNYHFALMVLDATGMGHGEVSYFISYKYFVYSSFVMPGFFAWK